MKKITSLCLSFIMLCNMIFGLNFSAYANNMDTTYDLPVNGGIVYGQVYYENHAYTADFYRMYLSESGNVSLNISATEGVRFFLYASDGKTEIIKRTLEYDFNFGRVQEIIDFELRAGAYYIKIGRYVDDSSYQISSSFTPVVETFLESDVSNNDYVDTASAIMFNTLYYGHIGLNEQDFYSLYVPSKTDIKVNIDNYTTMMTIRVSLLDYNGKVIRESGIQAQNGHIAGDIVFETLETGQYYIKISDYWIGLYGYGQYAFSISQYCNHDFQTAIISATYVSKGYRRNTCKKCGYSYNYDYTSKKALGKTTAVLKSGKKQLKVTWKKVSGVSGYQVQYSTSKKFYKSKSKTITVKGSKKNSKTIKKLKGKKKYYVRVRTYKTVKLNGKSVKVYSKWSTVKSVKTK